MSDMANKNEITIFIVDYNVVVVYFTLFLIVVMISNIMQRLSGKYISIKLWYSYEKKLR